MINRSTKAVLGLAILMSALFLGLACGGGSSGDAADVVIDFRAENFKFSPDRIQVPAGKTVLLRMRNAGDMEHDFQVDGLRAEMMDNMSMAGSHAGMSAGMVALHTPKGKSASMTFRTDQRGTYEFYCTISGHKELGMKGTLLVE